jgi:hypothetical protein
MSKKIEFSTLASFYETNYEPAEHVPDGLEYEAICSDPYLKGEGFFQIRGAPELGVFFKCVINAKTFMMHCTRIKSMYRIDNFVLKRNYYLTEAITGEDSRAKQKAQGLEPQSHPPLPESFNEEGEKEEDVILLPKSDVSARTTDKMNVSWGDQEDDPMDLNQNLLGLSTGHRKDTNIVFCKESYLDGLPTVGQNWVPFSIFAKKYRDITNFDFYLFDYAAMFVNPKTLFNKEDEFKFSYVREKLQWLSQLEYGTVVSLNTDNSGFGPITRFLCQSLNGELQVAFLRTALFFCVRKLATSRKIQSLKIDEETKSFFLGNESIKDDLCRIVRLNLKAFSNNSKLQIDEQYAVNFIYPVTQE